MWCPYRKPTQVGEEKILRRARELVAGRVVGAEEGGSENLPRTGNQQERSRTCFKFEKSSETARQTVPDAERMIQSDLHGNMQSAAEMTAPGEKSSSNNDERS